MNKKKDKEMWIVNIKNDCISYEKSFETNKSMNTKLEENNNVNKKVNSYSEGMIDELNNKKKMFSFKWLSLVFIILPIQQDALTFLFLLSLLIFHIVDKKRKETLIYYNIEENEKDKIKQFYDSFNDILKSNKKWHIKSKTRNYNIKQSYGGTSSSIKQEKIRIKYKTPPYIKTNTKSICIPIGKRKMYFLPDVVLIYDKKNIRGLKYEDLNIETFNERMVWTSVIKPFDSEMAGYTYAHVNINGTPDRRFNNNPRIPILNFTKILFYSDDSLDEEILLSKTNAGENLKNEKKKMEYKEKNKGYSNKGNEKNNRILEEKIGSETDPLLMDVISAVLKTRKVSIEFIQKRFSVGYSRAGRMIDQMEELGVISGYRGNKPREILINMEQWENLKNENTSEDILTDKMNYVKNIIKIMDDNDLGYQNMLKKISSAVDKDNNTEYIFKISMFVFINYIVDSNLLAKDYNIINKYIGVNIGEAYIENEYIFNELIGKENKNEKIPPLDWYCFFIQNESLIQKGLLKDNNKKLINSLIDVYMEIGTKIVENVDDNRQRKKRFDEYIKYCQDKLNEIKNQFDVAEKSKTYNKPNNEEINKEDGISDDETLEELIEQLNNLVGLEDVKSDIKSLINLIKVRKIREKKKIKQEPMSLHLVFSGNPGTGKTTVARLIAKIYHKIGVLSRGVFIETDRSDLVGGYVGQTAIKVKEVCNKAIGGVLFIDEAYSLNSKKDNNDFGKEAIETLLKFMEDNRDNFIVIVAGYTDLMEEFLDSNPGLKSRFNKFIQFNDYTPNELLEIFNKLCKDSEIKLSKEAEQYVKHFFEDRYHNRTKNFANARDVRNFFEKALVNQANRIAADGVITSDELQLIELEDVKNIKLKE